MNTNALAKSSVGTGFDDADLANGIQILHETAPTPGSFDSITSGRSIATHLKLVTNVFDEPMSDEEIKELQACEASIAHEWDACVKVSQESSIVSAKQTAREWNAYFKVGHALARIRDSHLYRYYYRTFAQYCLEKWHCENPQVYRFISAAKTFMYLSAQEGKLSRIEKQARPLDSLSDEQKWLAWKKAMELAGDKEIAVKHVKAAVAELNPPHPHRKTRAKRSARIEAVSVDDWQKAYEIIQSTLYFVTQGGNHPDNTEGLLKLLDAHLHKMESAST